MLINNELCWWVKMYAYNLWKLKVKFILYVAYTMSEILAYQLIIFRK